MVAGKPTAPPDGRLRSAGPRRLRAHKPAGWLRYTLALAFCALLTAQAYGSEQYQAPGSPRVEISDDRLSVTARAVPLGQLLKEIARSTKLTLIGHGARERPVSVQFEALPVSEALRRILRDETFVLHETRVDLDGQTKAGDRLWTLWLLSGMAAPVAPTDADTFSQTRVAGGKTGAPARGDNLDGRRAAVSSQRIVQNPSSVESLTEALTDRDPRVRVEAVRGLAAIGGDRAALALAGALRDGDAWVRHETAYALGAAGGALAAQALIPALHDPAPAVRERAILSYGEVGGETAARVVAVALNDPEAALRVSAAEALGDIGGATAAKALQEALDDPDRRVRTAAIISLGDIGGPQAASALNAALLDPEPELRGRARRALQTLEARLATEARNAPASPAKP